MNVPDNVPASASGRSSPTEPLPGSLPAADAIASADTFAPTFIERTHSQSGNESAKATSSAKSLREGSMLGPYQIVRKLGQGGMGAVYEARHTKLKKTVAVKVLPTEVSRDAALIARFEREMEAVGALDHPNIVRAMDANEQHGTHYLVMEYFDGMDLSQLVKTRGPMSVGDACEAIRQAALGLQHAHEHGLVHRDVKPSNLLMTLGASSLKPEAQAKPLASPASLARQASMATGFTIKILDLGLARLATEELTHSELTASGQVLGTPDYMAPEQWDDTHSADARADLYSLGCTLFFLLTGKAPFASDKPRSVLHLMRAHVDGEIPDLAARRPEVPAELNALFRSLMAKKPEQRFASAAEVATALEPFTHRHDASASSQPPPHDAPTSSFFLAAIAPPSSVVPDTEDNHSRSRLASATRANRSPWIIAAVVGVAVLVGIINRVSRDTRPTESEISNSKSQILNRAGRHDSSPAAPQSALAPFDTEQAKQHQDEWAKYLGVPIEYANSLGMKFVLIPPGEFLMGSVLGDIEETLAQMDPNDAHYRTCVMSEAPEHKVILTQPIYLCVHETTQKDYETVMGTNPAWFAKTGPQKQYAAKVADLDTHNHPVEHVSWNDAAEFCTKLCQKETLTPFYLRADETVTLLEGVGYRLPTEAEWEFACRSGTTTKFWIGDQDHQLLEAGWIGANSGGRTHAVGELKANPFGLFDIHGNVREWCHDFWQPAYYRQFESQAAIDPSNADPEGVQRVLRGGNYSSPICFCRASHRHANFPTPRNHFIGFRVSLTVNAVKELLKREQTVVTDAPKPALSPFNAEQAKQHQDEWAKYLGVPVEYTNSIGMQFRLIPPGEFQMGLREEELIQIERNLKGVWLKLPSSGAPQHRVVLTRPYYAGTFEVTQAEFATQLPAHSSHFSANGPNAARLVGRDLARYPVELLTWDQAVLFCQKLTASEEMGTSNSARYRLFTEAEWEFACRAGTVGRYSAGNADTDLPRVAWFEDNADLLTHPVEQLEPNPFGLFDIHGNVSEWVADVWTTDDFANRAGLIDIDPRGPNGESGATHVHRGGNFVKRAYDCFSAFRNADVATATHPNVGFRIALSVESVKQQIAKRNSQPDSAVPANGEIDFTAERKAAEWVLSVGGQVVLQDPDERAMSLVEGKLPQGRVVLVGTTFHDDPRFNVEGLSLLRACRKLDGLQLHALARLTDAGVKRLEGTPVRQLWLNNCPLLTDQATLSIATLRGLHMLSLRSRGFTDAGVADLQPLQQLTVFWCADSGVTDQGLARLAEVCPQIASLGIEHSEDEKRSVRGCQRFLNLTDLGISGNQLTEDAMTFLNDHHTLTSLYLHTPISDETIRRLARLQHTQTLAFVSYTNEAAANISETIYSETDWPESVTRLTFEGLNVSPRDRDLVHFAKLSKIAFLNLTGGPNAHYTAEGIAKFRELRPDVQVLVDGK